MEEEILADYRRRATRKGHRLDRSKYDGEAARGLTTKEKMQAAAVRACTRNSALNRIAIRAVFARQSDDYRNKRTQENDLPRELFRAAAATYKGIQREVQHELDALDKNSPTYQHDRAKIMITQAVLHRRALDVECGVAPKDAYKRHKDRIRRITDRAITRGHLPPRTNRGPTAEQQKIAKAAAKPTKPKKNNA